MSSPVNPQLQGTPAPSNDQRELLTFLREEAEANREAQRKESEANRKLFLGTSAIVAIPLTVLLTLSGIFFYHDVDTMKKAMEAQGEASAQVEIQRMDKHIDDTLQEKFKSEAIQNTIQQAAVVATRQEAPALIKEVITPEVKRAVASQSGTIREVATLAATDEVKSAIDPVVADVKLQAVIARANADDTKAFDELLSARGTGAPNKRDLVNGVIVNLQRHAREEFSIDRTSYYYECANPTGASYQSLLTSPLVEVRKNAINDCIAYMGMGQGVPRVPGDSVSAYTVVETIVPMWIRLVFNDSSLSVRSEAVKGLNWLLMGGIGVPNNGFDLLDTTWLRDWWTKNANNQAAIALIAYAHNTSAGSGHIDEVGLYDEVQRLAKVSPLGQSLEELRERMRSEAASIPSVDQLGKQMGRSCEAVQQDLGIRLKNFSEKAENERVDGYAVLEMQYLATATTCSVQPQFLTRIAEYGVSTRSLRTRYAAVEIVNRSSNASLDHYDPKPLEEWLRTHTNR